MEVLAVVSIEDESVSVATLRNSPCEHCPLRPSLPGPDCGTRLRGATRFAR
jgi:hypothetical protein